MFGGTDGGEKGRRVGMKGEGSFGTRNTKHGVDRVRNGTKRQRWWGRMQLYKEGMKQRGRELLLYRQKASGPSPIVGNNFRN